MLIKRTRNVLAGVLGLCLSIAAPILAPAAETEGETDPRTLYTKEIAQKMPDSVVGMTILRGEVTKSRSVMYCPLRTAQCGHKPTCEHAKKEINVYNLKAFSAIHTRGKISISRGFEEVNDFRKNDFQVGDPVFFMLLAYKNGTVSQPSNIRALPKPPTEVEDQGAGEDTGR